jgi:hypothetical protein
MASNHCTSLCPFIYSDPYRTCFFFCGIESENSCDKLLARDFRASYLSLFVFHILPVFLDLDFKHKEELFMPDFCKFFIKVKSLNRRDFLYKLKIAPRRKMTNGD